MEAFGTAIDVEVTQASTAAIRAVEAAGGRVRLVHYDRVSLRKVEHAPVLASTLRSAPPPQWLNRRLRHPLQSVQEAHADGVHVQARERRTKEEL